MSWTALLHPPDSLAILALALIIEAAAGYPDWLYRALGHPVTWIGRLIDALDRGWNHGSHRRRRLAGIAALLVLLLITGLAAIAMTALAGQAWPLLAIVLLALAAASLPAQRSLYRHVAAVAHDLRREGLEGGRRSISQIVGRNPDSLDEPAICRAAIESLAENFSDGIVAPAFWLGAFGLPGGVLYKAANTADSMIGHRTERHEAFGWAAARFDDLINLPASRLSALLLISAAALHPDASARMAWHAMRRYARLHRSPNAGWPEAAMAGALGLRLAGPRTYGETRIEDAWMGDGNASAQPNDILRALRLYRTACAIMIAMIVVMTFAMTFAMSVIGLV